MKRSDVIEIVKEMFDLIETIKMQSKDNPKLAETILGKSILEKTDRILQKIN